MPQRVAGMDRKEQYLARMVFVKWKDQDSGQRAVTVAIWSCAITVLVFIASTAVSLYIWLHPVDLNHPPIFGFPTWFWAILGSWGPPMLSGGFALVCARIYRAAKRLQLPAAALANHQTQLQEKDDLIAKLMNREKSYLEGQKQSTDRINELTNAAHADKQKIDKLGDQLRVTDTQLRNSIQEHQKLQNALNASLRNEDLEAATIKNKRLDELLTAKELELQGKQTLLQDTANALAESEQDREKKSKRIKTLEDTQTHNNERFAQAQREYTMMDERRIQAEAERDMAKGTQVFLTEKVASLEKEIERLKDKPQSLSLLPTVNPPTKDRLDIASDDNVIIHIKPKETDALKGF